MLKGHLTAVGAQQPAVIAVHLERAAVPDSVDDQKVAAFAEQLCPGVEQHIAVRVTGLGGEADDGRHVGQLTVGALPNRAGEDVVGEADNGEEALELVRATQPDIVLMDLHMPVMDGLEATQAIRAHGHTRRATVPVVALTADVFVETRERCAAAGVQDFLTKPVDTSELAACLAALVTAQR